MIHDGDEDLVERLTSDAGTDDGALQFDENALPRSGRSSAWGDGQITPEIRDEKGQFDEVVDVGRSLSQDRKRQAEHESKPGHGDRGDRKR